MKPNSQDNQWLQEYLYQITTYRETYEEIYGYVSNALQYEPEQKFFASAVNNVMSKDFGGSDALHEMEENSLSSLEVQVKKQYWFNLYQWAKFPSIVFTIIVFTCVYYLYTHSFVVVPVLSIFLFLIPGIVFATMGLGRRKLSMKYSVFRKIIYRVTKSCFIYGGTISPIIISFISASLHYPSIAAFSHSIIGNCLFSIMVTFLIIHTFSIIMTYKSKFNTNLKFNNKTN